MFWLSLVVFGFSALEFWISLRLRMDFSFFVLWSWLHVSFNSLDYILAPAALHYSANLVFAWAVFAFLAFIASIEVMWHICKLLNPNFHACVNRLLYNPFYLSAGSFVSGLWLHCFRYF